MAALKYGKRVLVSRPRYDPEVGLWRPCARVLWRAGKDVVQSHRFKLNQRFDSEEDALLFGLVVARMWIRERTAKARARLSRASARKSAA